MTLTDEINKKHKSMTKDNPGHAEKSYSMDTVESSRGPVGVQYLLPIAVCW